MDCCNGGVVAADDESGPLFVVCIFSLSGCEGERLMAERERGWIWSFEDNGGGERERERRKRVCCVDWEGLRLRSGREVVGTWGPVTSSKLDLTVLIRP